MSDHRPGSGPRPGPGGRPRQVTTAAWLIMGGSVGVVLTVFERVSGLHSLETREAIQSFLADQSGSELGLDVPTVITILRVLCMVAAGCATAAAILGFQVLRRNRAARVALTVLAAPLFVAGLVTGGFLPAIVAASSVMLWLPPSREWFRDGSAPAPAAREADGHPDAPRDAPRETPPGQGSPPQVPPPHPGPYGASWPQPTDRPTDQPTTRPTSQPPDRRGPGATPQARPSALVWACALTWALAGIAAALSVVSIAVLASAPDVVFEELHRREPDLAAQGVSDDALRTATFAVGAVVIAWCLVAIVVAALAFRGVRWARVSLAVSAGAAAAVCLLGAVANVVLMVPLAAGVATVALLVRPEVRAWFDRT